MQVYDEARRACIRANVEAVWLISSPSESDGAGFTGCVLRAGTSCIRTSGWLAAVATDLSLIT